MGKKTVAEFVADEETVGLLRTLGVDLAQGYHVGVPGPVSEVLQATEGPGRSSVRRCLRLSLGRCPE